MKKTPAAPLKNGGIAVTFALVMCLLGAEVDYLIVLSLFLLAGIALLNGVLKLPESVPFIIQIVAITLPFFTLHLPAWSYLPIGIAWIWFIRIFATFDRADGVIPAHTIAIGLGLCLILVLAEDFPSPIATYALIIAGCGFGALWWGWPNATIRLGDVGNAPLAFAIGYVLLLAVQAGYGLAVLILPAYIMGEGLAMLMRGSETPACADSLHKEPRARYIAGIHMLLVLLAVLSSLDPEMAMFNLAAAYAMTLSVVWLFTHKDI